MASTATSPPKQAMNILIINPNSSQDMTAGIKKAVKSLHLSPDTTISYYTAPTPSPPSIDDQATLLESARVVLNDIPTKEQQQQYDFSQIDGVLVACYSTHPLVEDLSSSYPHLAVTGIMQASIAATLPLLGKQGRWGIVTTGSFWETNLREGVEDFLGCGGMMQARGMPGNGVASAHHDGAEKARFAGVFSTGLCAGDFHGGDYTQETITQRMKDATRKLLDEGQVSCVVMGCAGMSGLEDVIREVIVEKHGKHDAPSVYIVDGVRAGVGIVEQMIRHRRLFQA